MNGFEIVSTFQPQGDQPQAIDKLVAGLAEGKKFQNLMGVTGSGKTFTMAHTIARGPVSRHAWTSHSDPTLVPRIGPSPAPPTTDCQHAETPGP